MRHRHVLVLTDAQLATIRAALAYVDTAFVPVDATDGASEGMGDITRRFANQAAKALAIVDRVEPRDVTRDSRALCDVLGAACGNSCSCVSVPPHARDCYVNTNRASIERVESLRKLLLGGT